MRWSPFLFCLLIFQSIRQAALFVVVSFWWSIILWGILSHQARVVSSWLLCAGALCGLARGHWRSPVGISTTSVEFYLRNTTTATQAPPHDPNHALQQAAQTTWPQHHDHDDAILPAIKTAYSLSLTLSLCQHSLLISPPTAPAILDATSIIFTTKPLRRLSKFGRHITQPKPQPHHTATTSHRRTTNTLRDNHSTKKPPLLPTTLCYLNNVVQPNLHKEQQVKLW